MICPKCGLSMTTETMHSIEWECTFGCGMKLTEGHFSDLLKERIKKREERASLRTETAAAEGSNARSDS